MRYITGFSCLAGKATCARDQDLLLCPALAKTWKGINELRRLGWCGALPRMTLARATACDPIALRLATALRASPRVERKATIARAVAHRPGAAWRARRGRGARLGRLGVAVSDDEIRQAMRDLAAEGLFIESSASVSVAGLRRLVASGRVARDECVVCVPTGSGFKDFERVLEMISIPDRVVGGFEEMLEAATAAA